MSIYSSRVLVSNKHLEGVGGVFWGSHGFKEERKGDPSSLTEYKGESRENLLPMRGGGKGEGRGH